MNLSQVAIVMLRLFGIYCFIQAVQLLTSSISGLYFLITTGQSIATAYLATVFPSALLILFGILLFLFSKPLGLRIGPGGEVSEGNKQVEIESIQAIAFLIAGLFIFCSSIPALFRSVYYLSTIWKARPGAFSNDAGIILEILGAIGTIVQAGLGVFLVFGARGCSRILHRLRTAGT